MDIKMEHRNMKHGTCFTFISICYEYDLNGCIFDFKALSLM